MEGIRGISRTWRAMNDAEIFDCCMSDNGGRVVLSLLEPSVADGLAYVAKRACGFLRTAAIKLSNLPAIHFDFINDLEFNATAFRHCGRYFIGLNRGTVATLNLLFDRVLGDPEIIPFIGEATNEVSYVPVIRAFGELKGDFNVALEGIPLLPRPNCKGRQALAGLLKELAFDFIVAHEFAHISNGHVDFWEKQYGIAGTNEISTFPGGDDVKLARQTMEMDADASAVIISLGSEWRKLGRDEYYRMPGLVCYFWAFAVLSVCRLFGDTRLTVGGIEPDDYPTWRLRGVMIQHATAMLRPPRGMEQHRVFVTDEPDEILKIIKAAQISVENAFEVITGQPKSLDGLNDAWGEPGQQQIKRLREYWQTTLRSELLPFAYHPLNHYGAIEVTE